jgi:hypothetical protein
LWRSELCRSHVEVSAENESMIVQGTQSNTRYAHLSERHTQWDTKTAAIYEIGRKSFYKITLQHQVQKLVMITTACLSECSSKFTEQ